MNVKVIFIAFTFLFMCCSVMAQDDYYRRKAESYTREAEFYQKKADGYRREAEYYLKKAEGYQREAAYYTKIGKLDNAKTYTCYAESAMDKYKTQVKYAS